MAKQLTTADLVSPGRLGLNLEESSNILPPEFATKAENAVIDRSGRLAGRRGTVVQTTTAVGGTPPIKTIFQYRRASGSVQDIVAWDGGMSNSIVDLPGNDITGTANTNNGRWWMQNFNDKCLGFQTGQKLGIYTGTAFDVVVESAGTAPRGNVALAAFGRIWQLDTDGTTIKYCALLDETDWGGAGAGEIDMSSVWTSGTDRVTAIVAFNGFLVIFGERHIVFYTDGTVSDIGITPDNIEVQDVITGTGCVSQWTLQPIGETDLLFVSINGVQSLSRVIQEKSTPIATLSKKVRTKFLDNLNRQSNNDNISTVYDPVKGFYLVTMPDNHKTWCFDQRFVYQDAEGDSVSPATEWTIYPHSWDIRDTGDILLGGEGTVSKHKGSSDDGTAYRFKYASPWMDLGEDFANKVKILKRIGSVLFVKNDTDITFSWGFDFAALTSTITRTISAGDTTEWNLSEWSNSEWSGGVSLRLLKVPARGTGQYVRVQVEMDVTSAMAIQQLELFTKIGRTA